MEGDFSDLLSYAAQLPIVALVVWLVLKFIGVMKEEREGFQNTLDADRKDFLGELEKERTHRAETADKLDTTMTGLTAGMSDVTHTLTELRNDVRAQQPRD